MIKVNFNGRDILVNPGTTIEELTKGDKKFICAVVDNSIKPLSYPIRFPVEIKPLGLDKRDSQHFYLSALRYIIAMAMKIIDPDHDVILSYSISRCVYVKYVDSQRKFTSKLASELKSVMDSITKSDYKLSIKKIPNHEAKRIFKNEGYFDKLNALDYRPEKLSHICTCNGYHNYTFDKPVPSTGYINKYKIILYDGGVLVQYPRSECNGEIPIFEDAPVFHRVLQKEYKVEKITGADTVYKINKKIEENGDVETINLAEALHYQQITEIGNDIQKKKDTIKLICIAGPSSSGKTTFANKLRIELLSRGYNPIRISMDDYFYVDNLEKGRDIESTDALDIPFFVKTMKDLINGKKIKLPHFNFQTREREFIREVQLKENQPIIVEGIHALNNIISDSFDRQSVYKIFIQPCSQINLDNHNPLSLTDLRLLRRIVRDYKYRNCSPQETIDMWTNVRLGEFKWIYKTQETADYIFNSLLFYELCAMKPIAMPILKKISREDPRYPVAERLIRLLKYFVPIPMKNIPCNSLLREFLGGSCYSDV